MEESSAALPDNLLVEKYSASGSVSMLLSGFDIGFLGGMLAILPAALTTKTTKKALRKH